METLIIELIKRYRREIENVEDETEKKTMYKVTRDLEKLVYLCRPSATLELTDWGKQE